ncbi:triacylglycerol lipase [Massilia sp. IC2-476]|uniref:esterase/lipase family protein n=1 Tax=Massilia sp. IC2-476 TaxID=2887199 RepID=UPI001D122303|nr:GPI inositol-deacylase [Massilia sp. IC2-476]MCC2970492.1 GPI inositol-deacylase [Massilia sp. IC2-476]
MAKSRAAVVFIHGLAKKPEKDELLKIWHWALLRDNPMPNVFGESNKGMNLDTEDAPTIMSYYADVFYGKDYERDLQSYFEQNPVKQAGLELNSQGLTEVESGREPPIPVTPREAYFLEMLESKLAANLALEDDKVPDEAALPTGYEVAGFVPRRIREAIIKKAAMEAYYFLFNKEYVRPDGARFMVREALRQRLLDDVNHALAIADKVVIVSHSMGTMVAYDLLRNVKACPRVSTLITLGSPLGVREVQAELAPERGGPDFPERVDHWVNIYDPLDPICGPDPRFANDYRPFKDRSVKDIRESNWGSWRHTITHYLAGVKFRAELTTALDRAPGVQ